MTKNKTTADALNIIRAAKTEWMISRATGNPDVEHEKAQALVKALALLDSVQAGSDDVNELLQENACRFLDGMAAPVQDTEQPEVVTVEELGNIIEMAMASRSEFTHKTPRENQNHPADFYANFLIKSGLVIVRGEK